MTNGTGWAQAKQRASFGVVDAVTI